MHHAKNTGALIRSHSRSCTPTCPKHSSRWSCLWPFPLWSRWRMFSITCAWICRCCKVCVCIALLDIWDIVGCYQNLTTCRGRGRLSTEGSNGRSVLPKIAMQGENANTLRETINSPGNSQTRAETVHSLFFLFCFCLWAACAWYGRARVQLPCCLDALWKEAGDTRLKDPRSSVLRAFPNLEELHWGFGGRCSENPQRAP